MALHDIIQDLRIPPRSSNHRGTWVPLYLDLLPGSGERICIGVIAADTSGVTCMQVHGLDRLHTAYGPAVHSIAWSATLATLEATAIAERNGLHGLADALTGIEGLTVGSPRVGVGRDLKNLATLGLRQSSTLVACDNFENAPDLRESDRTSPLAKAVQKAVVAIRPELRDNFRRHVSLSAQARPTTYGFVGRRLIANFASLGGVSADALGPQIDKAKARLWDLEQLQKVALRDVFGQPLKNAKLELLACPPLTQPRQQDPKRPLSPGLLKEAVNTLEREADKFEIQWRYLKDPEAVAGIILEREAA